MIFRVLINNHLAQEKYQKRDFCVQFFSDAVFGMSFLLSIAPIPNGIMMMMLFYCQNYCRHIDLNCSIMINNYTREMWIYISSQRHLGERFSSNCRVCKFEWISRLESQLGHLELTWRNISNQFSNWIFSSNKKNQSNLKLSYHEFHHTN